MKTNVYSILWADDDVDALIDRYEERFNDNNINIIERAHDGKELEKCLSRSIHKIDAVIVDANFNYTITSPDSKLDERNVTGLEYAHSLYVHKFNRSIPFFLFTQRIDEMLHEKLDERPEFNDDFIRHKNWFRKNDEDELIEMFEAIKKEIEQKKSPSFIVRNRYKDELAAASVFDGVSEFVLDFLLRDYTDSLNEMIEPFVQIRRSIEKMFAMCESLKLIPPISDDINGTAGYFLRNKYSKKNETGKWIPIYIMNGSDLMAKPLAQSLSYIVDITQDASHSKGKLTLKVDDYFRKTSDVLLLRSVAYILIDCIKWFTLTAINHRDIEVNECTLWEKIDN